MAHARWEHTRLFITVKAEPVERIINAATFFYYVQNEAIDWRDDEVTRLGATVGNWSLRCRSWAQRVKEKTPSITWGIGYVIGYSLWFKRPFR